MNKYTNEFDHLYTNRNLELTSCGFMRRYVLYIITCVRIKQSNYAVLISEL